jgi:peroxiredoxin
MEQKASPSLLSDEIQAFQDQLLPTVPEETMDILINELQQLINCGIAEKAIKLGDSFPNFRLPNANNETRSFSDFLANGPLVISFYRGAWCPYCNLEIKALQQRLPEINAAGGQLVAISPQLPDKSASQTVNAKLDFDVLSDIKNKLAKECGLVFSLPETLRPIYVAWELDIPWYNGDKSFELPNPATYIIDTDSKVHYAHIDMDYTKRFEPNIIIEQLLSV